jgi:pimeloyl-ACP methyl ester carboxylesterase
VLPALERHHDVLAPTLMGHAGGPPLEGEASEAVVLAAVERAMDEAGFETAHIAGNSLGGYIALQLAVRGRARSVVALAPAGGWAVGDESVRDDTLGFMGELHEQLQTVAPHAEAIASTPEGRRNATRSIVENCENIPPALVAQIIRAAAACDGALPMIEYAKDKGYHLDAEKVTCPVRVVWGTEDRLLAWPSSAARYRSDWLPHADWVELDGVGHCPQLEVPLETAQLILGFTGG